MVNKLRALERGNLVDMTEQSAAAPKKLHYGWIVVGVAFVAMLVAAGTRSVPSVLIVPLENEFGWSRASISLAIAVQLMLFGLVGPFSAGFIDRFGLRRTMIGALLMMASGMALLPFVTAPWQLQPILGIFMGLATGALAMIMAAIVANRWFIERRGLVMGLLSGSTAAGQLIFLPSFAQGVEGLGWRPAVFIGGGVLLAVIPIVWLFIRDEPRDVGLKPFGAKPDAPDLPRPVRANPFTAAFAALGKGSQHRDFWLLSGSFFVCGASTIGLIGTHFIPACLDHGIPETAAAGILGAMGACNIVGTTAAGWLSDRFDNRFLLCWFYASRGASLLFLPYALDMAGPWGLAIFGLFYGLDWIATVPPTVKLTTAAFGSQQSAVVYGWIMVMHQVGSATAAYGSGLVRTLSGEYTDAFWISGGLCVIAAIMVLRIGRKQTGSARPALVSAEA
jgi:predicted MFS family arabinose efflux permease